MAPQIAWIGLGNMGRGMCKNLAEKGNLDKPVILYNRTKKRADDFSSQLGADKTKVVDTIKDAVSSADIIIMCLGNDASVNSTVDTILESSVTGKLIVDSSTIHPNTSNALEKRITEKGAEFVAMPVFGAPAMADAGQLICVAAGSASAVEKVKPYTTGVMGRAIIDYSAQPAGNSSLLKIVGNTFIINMVEQLSQGHVLAEKTGLGSANLHLFLENLFPGPYAAYSKRMMDGDYYQREEPLFHVDLALKDAGHALALAEENGCSAPFLKTAIGHFKQVKEHCGDKGDAPGIYGAVRQESGLKFENKD